MEQGELESLIGQLARSLGAWARSSPQGRQALADAAALLRAVAEAGPDVAQPPAVCVETPPPPAPAVMPAPVEVAPAPAPVVTPPVRFAPAPAVVSGPRLAPEQAKRLLESGALVRGATTTPGAYADYAGALFDLSRTERRCRVKADACDFALRRQRHVAGGGSVYDFKIEWEEVKGRAEALVPCWLWMTRDWDSGIDDEILVRAREWYLNLAAALALAKDHLETHTQPVLERIAEAQSGLRVTLQEAYAEDRDTQLPTFTWVREQAEARGIFLPRFLALHSPADGEDYAGARERIERLRAGWEAASRRDKDTVKALNDLKYNVKRLASATPEEAAHHWKKIDAAATRHGETGGDAEGLAAALGPVADYPAEEAVAAAFGERLRAALAGGAATADEDDEEEQGTQSWRLRPTPELLATREALRGRMIVLVGGIEKANPARALKEAFELDDVRWISSGEHQSLTRFESDIARPETALVVVMIRWASHSYEGLKEIAQKHGKLYLRLKGGYSPNNIAHEFMGQNSQRTVDIISLLRK